MRSASVFFVCLYIAGYPNQADALTELFSVAPMMGHTNRYWRYFFRLLSREALLYTEMLPAATIAAAARDGRVGDHLSLHAIESPVSLQIGGYDIEQLKIAAAAGVEAGYGAINLNCGCPSNAVAGVRRGGAALMREPAHVKECCIAMHDACQKAAQRTGQPVPEISVKHRLGVADVATYDLALDQTAAGAIADLESARSFVQTVAESGVVTKFQVHARKALLGGAIVGGDNRMGMQEEGEDEVGSKKGGREDEEEEEARSAKVNHKRVMYQAKRKASAATVDNRSVPPLRPEVVYALAHEFPSLEFVANGGIECIAQAQAHISQGAAGSMVGRAVINHPCAFASVDQDIFDSSPSMTAARTRREVMEQYIEYVAIEEVQPLYAGDNMGIFERRRRLVAPPFNLFAGETGHYGFMRRIRKLTSHKGQYSAAAVLRVALKEVPGDVLDKPLTDAIPLNEVPRFDFGPRRAGPLQRHIY